VVTFVVSVGKLAPLTGELLDAAGADEGWIGMAVPRTPGPIARSFVIGSVRNRSGMLGGLPLASPDCFRWHRFL
jgi:hypothetical protein